MPLEDEDSIWVVVNEEKKIYTVHACKKHSVGSVNEYFV